jgi:integrating conjugative element membrane protein (TIGR03747 family)
MLAQVAWAYHLGSEGPVPYQQRRLEIELQAMAALQPKIVQPVGIANFIGTTIRGAAEAAATVTARTLMNIPGQARQMASSEFIRSHPDPGGFFARELLAKAGADWDLLVLGTFGFAIRTAMYIAIIPVLALAAGLGLVDGLVQRAKRKANAMRESSSLYHRAKLGVSASLISGYIVILGLPTVDEPAQLLLPIAAAVGVLLRLQAQFYKKYL